MTDRDVMMAIYKAIEILYAELTQKPLAVEIDTDKGKVLIQSLGGTSDACISRGMAAQAS